MELLSGTPVASASNVVFDHVALSDGNISYSAVSGVITINNPRRYLINWWVATQLSQSTHASFSPISSQGDELAGTSAVKTGEVGGVGVILVEAAPVTVSLVNTSGASYNDATNPLVKAGRALTNDNAEGATGATGPTGPTGPTGDTPVWLRSEQR